MKAFEVMLVSLPASVTVIAILRSVVSGILDELLNVIDRNAVTKVAAVSPLALDKITIPLTLSTEAVIPAGSDPTANESPAFMFVSATVALFSDCPVSVSVMVAALSRILTGVAACSE